MSEDSTKATSRPGHWMSVYRSKAVIQKSLIYGGGFGHGRYGLNWYHQAHTRPRKSDAVGCSGVGTPFGSGPGLEPPIFVQPKSNGFPAPAVQGPNLPQTAGSSDITLKGMGRYCRRLLSLSTRTLLGFPRLRIDVFWVDQNKETGGPAQECRATGRGLVESEETFSYQSCREDRRRVDASLLVAANWAKKRRPQGA